MKSLPIFLASAICLSSHAAAQTTTADGVQAIARGDYASAVRILRPLAEDGEKPDPLAQFFLATLYEAGRGVPMEQFRACALYLKASGAPNPLAQQAATLAERISAQGGAIRAMCLAASRGTWREPKPATFTLGPQHSVKVDSGLTVTYQGTEKRALLSFGGADLEYLPVRYTRVAVTSPVEMERHFIDVFVWMPLRDRIPSQWILPWFVYEVIGADVRMVPDQKPVASVVAERPPLSEAPEKFGIIRVNADGEAERVFFGSNPRIMVIPVAGSP